MLENGRKKLNISLFLQHAFVMISTLVQTYFGSFWSNFDTFLGSLIIKLIFNFENAHKIIPMTSNRPQKHKKLNKISKMCVKVSKKNVEI